MKAYLAAPIFTERDRNFNSYLEAEILKVCPDLDLYLAQNNQTINDKSQCATSADIYVGDISRLKQADLVISIMSGDLPPIGSSYETAYFCALCEQDDRKTIIALYDDSREGSKTYSSGKLDAMLSGIGENQWPYVNLLAVGYVKKNGVICSTSEELIRQVKRQYDLFTDSRQSGIYKITNLKNNMIYIGQTKNLHDRKLQHWRPSEREKYRDAPLYQDMNQIGLDYFKFEIIEKCDLEQLSERERYWIDYYDSYNLGYNRSNGGCTLENMDNFTSSQTTEIYCYNLDGSFDKKYCSISSAARAIGFPQSRGDISRCALLNDNHHQSGGKMWSYHYIENFPPYQPPLRGKQIHCYDLKTRLYIKSYDNAVRAGEEIFGHRAPHINDAATGKRCSCGGYLWAYEYFERLPEKYHENL